MRVRLIPQFRLIPARAGKTTMDACSRALLRAHPRACGENAGDIETAVREAGSSPRVRGKLSTSQATVSREGLIPARAGKTGEFVRGGRGPGAHPRACGENRPLTVQLQSPVGSSPRVRGKQSLPEPEFMPLGLIPARAGKTTRLSSTTPAAWAHPRACGENPRCLGALVRERGSSPRVRGKHLRGDPVVLRGGLIPARAGKTS